MRGGTEQIIGAVYATDPVEQDDSLPHAAIAAQLVEATDEAGSELLDCLLVTRGRWWSYRCLDLDCCPAEGRPLPKEPSAVAATATYAGLTALPDRAALEDMFTPPPVGADLAEGLVAEQDIELAATLNGSRVRYVRSVVRAAFAAHRDAQAGRMTTDCDAARYGVALRSYAVRDAVWLAIDDGRLPGIELWVNLARRLPSPYAAAPLFLAAWRSYRDGNGALAGIAAERALASDPGYGAASLLLAALAHGVPPHDLRKLHPRDTHTAPQTGD